MPFYSYEWKSNNTLIAEIEVEYFYEIKLRHGQIEFNVNSILIDRTDLLDASSPTVKALAKEIKEHIEGDRDAEGECASEEGYSYRSRGGTDPDAQWVDTKQGLHG